MRCHHCYETRPNWARKVCDLDMSIMSMSTMSRLFFTHTVGEVAWLKGEKKMELKKKEFLLQKCGHGR